jgi:excisionase family DNA binding protein
LPIPSALLDAIADRVAERLADRLGEMRGTSAAWMRTHDAAEYLGLTRSALYSRTRDIPHHRFERMLLFKRTDLDAWVESHRVDPAPRNDRASTIQPPAASRPTRTRRAPAARAQSRALPAVTKEHPKRERPLPPPLCGDDTQKDNWAEQLEISRTDLDEMSPGDFKRAWEAPNERLRAGGVFDHLDELWKRLGQPRIDAMTSSELIEAVSELREEAARQEPPHRDAAEAGAPASGQPSA